MSSRSRCTHRSSISVTFFAFLLSCVLVACCSALQQNETFPEISKLPNSNKQQLRRRVTDAWEEIRNQLAAAKQAKDEQQVPPASQRPNVLFIVCDDLNDFVENLGGHPQAITPHIRRLMETSASFTQAHANIPLCKSSRSSFLTGLYPHTSKYVNPRRQGRPDEFEGLQNQRTLIEHFNENGYITLGTGKIYHGYRKSYFQRFGHNEDYGPFVYNTTLASDEGAKDDSLENLPHPIVPSPFRDEGPIDGSFGPLVELEDGLGWRTGNRYRGGYREIELRSPTDRDMTTDEKSAEWAIEQLREMASAPIQDDDKPFFLGVGLVRPHTPMVVPKKYFDMYPLETLELPPSILENDANDTFRKVFSNGIIHGARLYDDLIESFSLRTTALKNYLQAYLASVTAADELVGKILSALDETRYKDNTIVVFTSDHGYQVGQKDYLGKDLLWEATTRVPLIVRVPGMTKTATTTVPRTVDQPVTLVDLYPTLIDLCGLSKNTTKNEFSRPLDGHSLKPLLTKSKDGSVTSWDGPNFALSALSINWDPTDPIGLSLSTRYDGWRYIRYTSGKEELYNTVEDPYEWTNLALANNSTIDTLLEDFKTELFQFVEAEGFVPEDEAADIFVRGHPEKR